MIQASEKNFLFFQNGILFGLFASHLYEIFDLIQFSGALDSDKLIQIDLRFKIIFLLLSVVAIFLIPAHVADAFLLKVNLYDAKSDSGKVKVIVYSSDTGKKKSASLNIGKIVSKTGDSNVERLKFSYTDKQLPPNGAFSACVLSVKYDKTQCEQADRHYDARSAIIWVQVPE